MKKEDVFYTAGGDLETAESHESLSATTIERAATDYLESCYHRPDDFPEELVICEWRREEVDLNEVTINPLDNMLEALEERYNLGDEDNGEPTERMRVAERIFMQTVLDEYVPLSCKVVSHFRFKVPSSVTMWPSASVNGVGPPKA